MGHFEKRGEVNSETAAQNPGAGDNGAGIQWRCSQGPSSSAMQISPEDSAFDFTRRVLHGIFKRFLLILTTTEGLQTTRNSLFLSSGALLIPSAWSCVSQNMTQGQLSWNPLRSGDGDGLLLKIQIPWLGACVFS